ncbi:MAG: nuclear transport factor 2 family protein, partial [Actinomycetota bacterium]|nr:nuclear transport factor 2 family protein [Actinomycetota bacterium]
MRRLAAALAALALAPAVAACGGDSPPPPEDQVRETLTGYGRAVEAKDYDALCTRYLSPDLVERVNSIGLPCPAALRRGLGEVEDPRLTVGRIEVAGDRATAQVSTSAAGEQPSRDTVELQRVEGSWRLTSLGEE